MQVCVLAFELRDKTEDYIEFLKDGEGIRYTGDRNLADYDMVVEDLNITKSAGGHSVAIVKVVFRRQGGFHVVTTFVQTMVVILVAFVTFFFHVRNFTDRIMVNLILLLILAQIHANVQGVRVLLESVQRASNPRFFQIAGYTKNIILQND